MSRCTLGSAAGAVVVGPKFFGYETRIVEELSRQGYSAVFIDERPNNSASVRAVLRVRPSLARWLTQRHFHRALKRLRGLDLALLVVIKGEVVPLQFLQEIRTRHPSIRMVGYTFDSIANSPRFLELAHAFDEAFTFDKNDATRFGLHYLPLFYLPEFALAAQQVRPWDVCFVGTLHSGRHAMVTRWTAGRSSFLFFFVQARWYFVLQKYILRSAKSVPCADVSYSAMTTTEVAKVFGQSKVVIDIQRSGQSGLTMRTFEALAAGCILATTNESIREEPFYDSRFVVVIAETRSANIAEEIASAVSNWRPHSDWVSSQMSAYALASWIRTLISGSTR